MRSSRGSERPLIAIGGPTGSGKSALALLLAREFGGEIVNCDSLQLYRGFDIGTAKSTPEERAAVTHHLIDILDPDEVSTAGDYARRARAVVADIDSRGRLPVVAGGTGFYMRALLDGLAEAPQRDEAMRMRLASREARRTGSIHRLLTRLDPPSARRIHPRDVNKAMRALEVRLAARRPITELFERGRDALEGFRALRIVLNPPRQALYARIDERCRRMFDSGLLEEAAGLIGNGHAGAKPFESIGYAEALAVHRGELTREEAIESAQRNTRRYAKRQCTWFLRERGVAAFGGFGDETETRRNVVDCCNAFLKSFTDSAPDSTEQKHPSNV